jgi:hypothetical protein
VPVGTCTLGISARPLYARTLRGDARARFDALVRRAGATRDGHDADPALERKNFVLVVAWSGASVEPSLHPFNPAARHWQE